MIRGVLAAAAVTLLGTAALAWATHGFRAYTAETARRLAVTEAPRQVPDLPLQLQTGERSRLAELRGRLVVATFVFTRCRSTCPVLGLRILHIRERLPDDAVGDRVRFLSLSFDPARDRPERLRAYARRYSADPSHWWVARPRAGLERILDRLGVVVIPNGRGGYRHNAAFYLLDRRGRLVGIYDEARPREVVEAVEARL